MNLEEFEFVYVPFLVGFVFLVSSFFGFIVAERQSLLDVIRRPVTLVESPHRKQRHASIVFI